MMDRVHASHLGVQMFLKRAKPEEQKKAFVCHEIPTRLWKSVSADLFELNYTKYLVTANRYYNFFELDILTSKTRAVIKELNLL